MLLYRISRRLYSRDIEGIGAKLYGGRWNNVGTSCIYTSESRALAILEYAANMELDIIPRSLNMTIFEVPQEEFIPCKVSELPGDWKDQSFTSIY